MSSALEDSKPWTLNKDVPFSVNSLTSQLRIHWVPIDINRSKVIWRAKIPKKVKFFPWIFVKEKINTGDIIQIRNQKPRLQLNG